MAGTHRDPDNHLRLVTRDSLNPFNPKGSIMNRTPGVDNTHLGILQRLRAKVAAGKPIIGGGAGTGISAKCEEAGGIDLIVIYNSGRFRMAGRGSLAGLMPYGNANAIVKEMAYEVLTAVKHTPVLAGVCAHRSVHDPRVFPRRAAGRWASPGCRTFRRSA